MGHSVKNEKGNFQARYVVTTQYELHERGNFPQAKLAQQTELHDLTRAHHLSKGQTINMHTDSHYAFGVVHHLGC